MLFELISARYERRSLLITANQPFGEWGKIFPDPAMTLAAVDRLVHHATIFEMNVESYRRRDGARSKETRCRTPRALGHDQECCSVDAERQSTGDVATREYTSPGVTRDRGSWSSTLDLGKE